MDMADFLLVIPDGWIEVPAEVVATQLDETWQRSEMYELTQLLLESGITTDNVTEVKERKVFHDGTRLRVWVVIGLELH